MSLINDVRHDVAALETDERSLKKFAFLVGGVFAGIGVLSLIFGSHPIFGGTLLGIGVILILWGLVNAPGLRGIYLVWMTLAIGLGWFVSRLLLILLYYLILTPISLVARLTGQKFLKKQPEAGETSNWTPREHRDPAHMEKMY
jgi:hypothetical protein